MRRTKFERFTEKYRVDDETGCWTWQAAKNWAVTDGGWFESRYEPIPDLIRTVEDYEGLPDGTILETENTKTILVSYGGDVFRALDYVTTAQELVERKVVCSVVRLGGEQSA